MVIEFLQQVVENPTLRGFKNEPMGLIQIEELEQKYNNGNLFPIAFREYLLLAGDFNNISFDDLGEGLDKLQERAKRELERRNEKQDRPFFTFSVLDSQYSIFFLDEDKEDPEIYILDVYGPSDGDPLLVKTKWIFSDLVNEGIRRVKNNIAF